MYQAAVVTVSDRSFRGQRPDGAGPVVAQMLREAGYPVAIQTIVPDEQPIIEETLKNIADSGRVQLLVTTGGTGFSPRDVTPEAMRYASLQITPRAMLSRSVAGLRNQTLILNLPGSPKAAQENLAAVLPTLRHGLEMLTGGTADCAK